LEKGSAVDYEFSCNSDLTEEEKEKGRRAV